MFNYETLFILASHLSTNEKWYGVGSFEDTKAVEGSRKDTDFKWTSVGLKINMIIKLFHFK